MEELTKLSLELADCKRHSDNHRRSRDYHKETSAALRKEIGKLNEELDFLKFEHDMQTNELIDSRRHHNVWVTISIVAMCYGLAMTVLFAWAIRN